MTPLHGELCAGPDPVLRSPRNRIPSGATDTHFHVFGPLSQYPYGIQRNYTPPEATPKQAGQLFAALGIERAVLVQPTVYHFDNRRHLDAVSEIGIPARAIVSVPFETPDHDLEAMHTQGARGVRFVTSHAGGLDLATLERYANRLVEIGWHVDLMLKPDHLVELEPRLRRLRCPFVVDHMGMAPAADVNSLSGQALLRLVETGICWVKLSSAYRLSAERPPFQDCAPLANALVEIRPDRLLWGSDWPQPQFAGEMPNTADLLDALFSWVPDASHREMILVENPAYLYGFD